MNRKQKLVLNGTMGMLSQITVLVCGFLLTRFLLVHYGSAQNGLVSSITHFLSFISLLEMGIGPVIQANLYGPLSRKDNEEISKILKSAQSFFRKLCVIFLAYLGILCYIFPKFTRTDFSPWFTVSLLLIIAVSTAMQYFYGLTNQLLLNADQKSYVQLSIYSTTLLLNTIVSIVMMKCGCSIHAVYLSTAIIYLARPFGQMFYVKRHYQIDYKVSYSGEPIKQKWNGFAQHISSVVTSNVDIVTLTVFSTFCNISVYTVYYNVVHGLQKLVSAAFTGLLSLLGNMYARSEKEKLYRTFELFEYINHTVIISVYAIAMASIIPFVLVYTRGVSDANYNVPVFSILIVAAYAALCIRSVYTAMIFAAGRFKETQNGSIIAAVINAVISVVAVFKYGLVGVAVGTLISMLYYTLYSVYYLSKNVLMRSPKYFFQYLVTDTLTLAATMMLSRMFEMANISYLSWAIYALKVSLSATAVSALITTAFYRKQFMLLFDLIKNRVC